MNTLPMEWLLAGAAALAGGLLVCAVALLVLGLRLRRERLRGQRQSAALKKALKELARHQRQTAQGLQRLGTTHDRELRGLARKVEITRRQQQDLETRDLGAATWSQASRLVEMGAGSQDLVNNCGLSEAEARLVALMKPGRDTPDEPPRRKAS